MEHAFDIKIELQDVQPVQRKRIYVQSGVSHEELVRLICECLDIQSLALIRHIVYAAPNGQEHVLSNTNELMAALQAAEAMAAQTNASPRLTLKVHLIGASSPFARKEPLKDLRQLLQLDCMHDFREFVFNSEPIDKGNFGKVYLCDWKGEKVAVKRIGVPEGYLKRTGKSFAQVVHEEIKIFSKLDNPHVMKLRGITTDGSYLFLIMDYMSNGNLKTRIRQTEFENKELKKIAIDIVLGMIYLHNHKPCILHRDLHGGNILLDVHGNCKISDFGLSRALDSNQGDKWYSVTKGHMGYMPPESLVNSHRGFKFTRAGDVFSFGVLLWEMFMGIEAHGDNMDEWKLMIVNGQRRTLRPTWPVPIQQIITHCWAQIPSERPTFEQVHAKLVAWDASGMNKAEEITFPLLISHPTSNPYMDNDAYSNMSTSDSEDSDSDSDLSDAGYEDRTMK